MGLKDIKGFKRAKAKKSSSSGFAIPKEYVIGAVALAVVAFVGM
jgi:hypothetical protein